MEEFPNRSKLSIWGGGCLIGCCYWFLLRQHEDDGERGVRWTNGRGRAFRRKWRYRVSDLVLQWPLLGTRWPVFSPLRWGFHSWVVLSQQAHGKLRDAEPAAAWWVPGPPPSSPSRHLPVGAGVGQPVEDAWRCVETAGLPPKKHGLQVASMKAEPGRQFFWVGLHWMCDHGGGDGAGEEKAGGGVGFFFFHCCFLSQIYEITSWWFSYSNFRYEFTGVITKKLQWFSNPIILSSFS